MQKKIGSDALRNNISPTKITLATSMNSMLVTILAFQQFLTGPLLRGEPIPLGQWKYLEMLEVEAAWQSQSSKNLL